MLKVLSQKSKTHKERAPAQEVNPALCLEVFSNKLRFEIMQLLEKKAHSVNEIAQELNIERTRISHALNDLSKCHVVHSNKEGRQVIYSLNENTPLAGKGTLLELISQHNTHNCHTCHKTSHQEKNQDSQNTANKATKQHL